MKHWRAPNNWRAMRAVYGRQSANRSTELFASCLAAFVVAGFAIGMVVIICIYARGR